LFSARKLFFGQAGAPVYNVRMNTTPLNNELIGNLVFSLVILVGAFALFFGLKRAFQFAAQRANLPVLAFRPLRLAIRYTVLLVAASLILKRFGYNVDTLLAVIGTVLGLVAIGFVAVWSVLSNFLCTFVLILFKPFSIGDELEIPGDSVAGKVVDLTLIFTTLRNPTGEYIQVPNNIFFQKIFKRRAGQKAIDLGDQLRQEQPVE
jgi:small-conductance mechanosensitive channel